MSSSNQNAIEKKMNNSYRGEYYEIFKSFFDDAKNGICIVDYEGKIIELNNLYAQMFGYTKEDLLDQHYSQLVSQDSHATVQDNHYKVFNGTNILKAEEKVKHKNGTLFYVQTTNIKINDEFGNKLRITTAVNTSNRLRNELLQSVLLKISNLTNSTTPGEQLFASIYQAITELMPIRNFSVCIKNQSTNELEIPYTRNDKHPIDKSSIAKEHCYIENIKDTVLLSEHSILSLIQKHTLDAYEITPTLFIGIPLLAKNEILGSIIIKDYLFSDFKREDIEFIELVAAQVTRVIERKNYEEELITARNKAEDGNRIKSEFLAQISHEIRTPLNSILSFSSLIKNELNGTLTTELEETFNYIERGGNRLTRTIDLILNVAKSQNNQYKIQLEEIDIYKELLFPLKKELEGHAINKGIKLKLEAPKETLKMVCDLYSVNQLFSNLIENAIKYTHKGSVTLKAFNNNFGKTQINVEDTGIGISEEYIPKLFEAFSQEEQGYTRSYEGIGLGLSLVKNYADLNNAEIKVASQKNIGSIFSVVFN